MTYEELLEKIDDMCGVINHQSRVIKKLNEEIIKMKFVLGYEAQKQKLDVFLGTLEENGLTLDELMKKPELLNMALNHLRKM